MERRKNRKSREFGKMGREVDPRCFFVRFCSCAPAIIYIYLDRIKSLREYGSLLLMPMTPNLNPDRSSSDHRP